MYLGAALRKFGFALILVCAACIEKAPSTSPIPIRSKSKDAVVLSVTGRQLTVTPLVPAPRLEIRAARPDGSAKVTLFTFTDLEPQKPLSVEIPIADHDRVFSAAVILADGHRLVSSVRVAGDVRQANNVLRPERAAATAPHPPRQGEGVAAQRTFLGQPATATVPAR